MNRLIKLALLAVILGLTASFYAQYGASDLPKEPLICEKQVNINRDQYYMFYDCYRGYPKHSHRLPH